MSTPTHIFIDTSIFEGQKYSFSSTAFQTFIAATAGKNITILLPSPTHGEIIRHIGQHSELAASALHSSIKKHPFLRSVLPASAQKKSLEIAQKIEIKKKEDLSNFLARYTVEKMKVDSINPAKIMRWYELKTPPFGPGPKQKEFPDAFSLACLLEYCADNHISVAVISQDSDFEKACNLHSPLAYFESLSSYTETLLSENANLSIIRITISNNITKVKDEIEAAFVDLAFDHAEGWDAEVEDILVQDIEIEDFHVVHLGNQEALITFSANVDFSAHVTMDDDDTAIVDSSEGIYMALDEYRGTVEESVDISGSCKIKFTKDLAQIEKVIRVDLDSDTITVHDLPSETYSK